jgi:hypothetical protein
MKRNQHRLISVAVDNLLITISSNYFVFQVEERFQQLTHTINTLQLQDKLRDKGFNEMKVSPHPFLLQCPRTSSLIFSPHIQSHTNIISMAVAACGSV